MKGFSIAKQWVGKNFDAHSALFAAVLQPD